MASTLPAAHVRTRSMPSRPRMGRSQMPPPVACLETSPLFAIFELPAALEYVRPERGPSRSGAFTSRRLQESLLVLLLAGDAVAGPRHGFEALLLKLILAVGAEAVVVFLDAAERLVDLLQSGAVGVRLAEQKLLGIGVGRFVGQIHSGIVVGGAPFLFRTSNNLHQLFATGQEFLFVVFESLLVHNRVP